MKKKYLFIPMWMFLFVMWLLHIEHWNEVWWGIFEVVVWAALIVIYTVD